VPPLVWYTRQESAFPGCVAAIATARSRIENTDCVPVIVSEWESQLSLHESQLSRSLYELCFSVFLSFFATVTVCDDRVYPLNNLVPLLQVSTRLMNFAFEIRRESTL